jgi:Fe-S oxidoreductase
VVPPGLANWAAGNPGLRALARRHLGIASGRTLPRFDPNPFRDVEGSASAPAGSREVFLFADTFNRWFEPAALRATIRVLAAAGYRAVLPYGGARPLCCGRTALAAGQIDTARQSALRVIEAFATGLPVIGIEPSCLLTLRDEFPALLPGPRTEALARRAFLLSEFLEQNSATPPLRNMPGEALIHGHCHQKSFGAFPAALAMVRRIPGLEVTPIAASCCGMAGAFGYQAETQDVSRAMAEAALLPAVRGAAAETLIIADGTSCRHQIADFSPRRARHSVEVMADALA